MIKQIISLALFGFLSTSAYAAGGCCSGHGGVAQCGDDGYKYCTDGTRSPTCKCEPTPQQKPADTKDVKKETADLPTPTIALPPKPETKMVPLVGPTPKDPSK